jgi:hypothetical protein
VHDRLTSWNVCFNPKSRKGHLWFRAFAPQPILAIEGKTTHYLRTCRRAQRKHTRCLKYQPQGHTRTRVLNASIDCVWFRMTGMVVVATNLAAGDHENRVRPAMHAVQGVASCGVQIVSICISNSSLLCVGVTVAGWSISFTPHEL